MGVMVVGRLFHRNAFEAQAQSLYRIVVGQARRPEFYRHCGGPDTLDGRFEMIVLHAFLILHSLKADRPESADLAQALFDTLFLDMDQSLRELGASDLGVGRRVKLMAQGLYGRIEAYEAGLRAPGAVLEAALGRNLYGTVDGRRVAADHDLARCVVVCDVADIAACGQVRHVGCSFEIEPQKRCHCPLADRYRALHRLAAALQ